MGCDQRVRNNLGQILLVLVQRNVLLVGRDLDAGVICTEKDKLDGR